MGRRTIAQIAADDAKLAEEVAALLGDAYVPFTAAELAS